ncbi:isoleucine--tRNA ligase [Cryomorpha ignava]|uniref:Isoleucine--tRNA ligase n=1 Tax=Cryomorpha ignava TaxID=101383 RepID=A0A7K3WK84_9FLAO|nr:isoleucine--tRNA ligase [Cryomorpha ignava]NEN22063.1 isoleucine--tRNA ligase [Cryomorpha ignava]
MSKYREYKGLDLPVVANEMLERWKRENTFEKSVSSRPENKPFVFYEGPPSANGLPGIHHVMGRAIKDIFCRYKTNKGYRVERKAGWDTHGLPVELGVEKELGITKEDIGKTISVEAYNEACRKAVMKYTDVWNDLTEKMGYWVDMDDPYVTYENKYMESVWWILRRLYDKGLMYKGYTIQPYSPAAGTGLSSHEINQPGSYRMVKDTSATALFKLKEDGQKMLATLTGNNDLTYTMVAWTTTPWTLPSNTALAVNKKVDYVVVESFNQYTGSPMAVVLAKDLVSYQFSGKYETNEDDSAYHEFNLGDKKIPYRIIGTLKGTDLVGYYYEQLLPYVLPMETPEKAFCIIAGDFVTTEDGTGVVHIAPTFGADDAQVAKAAGVPPMLIADAQGNPIPLVDLQGRFVDAMGDELGGMYVKNEYYTENEPDKSVDVLISIKLKEENKAFKIEKYEHSYPHCWRTDKPILYYPLDSWFIKSTAAKDRLIALNKTINWKPESTGTGRFGNWLENLNDWNLSRSRFWGVPIPIWRTEDGTEELCIGSVEELKSAIVASLNAGIMKENPLADFVPGDMSEANYNTFDLHKNYMDNVVLVSPKGKPMHREQDLIDVWFDSGSMPYAQWHYPFENKDKIDDGKAFPADFIAEGVDQTRGWFFTLHAIATMAFDSIAYKSVISNGLVLDKNGQKMSKRLGNAVDPFLMLNKYGADATRWYMITNAQPWDNLRFDESGIVEVQRKFFGTLYNTYSFFALYANVDGFDYSENDVPLSEKPEIDRWVISRLNSLIIDVDAAYADYEPTKAGRLIQNFVTEELSNWYVRLCRRRFWKGDYETDKVAAYQTLYTCLETVSILSAPIAPFYMDQLFRDLNVVADKNTAESVHLAEFPESDSSKIDLDLERRMSLAQRITSMTLGLRKLEKIRVRQPLQKLMIPVIDKDFVRQVTEVSDMILREVNVKEIEFLNETEGILVKEIKADFKKLGPRFGKQMKDVAARINAFGQAEIADLERNGKIEIEMGDASREEIIRDEVLITTKDIPGWLVASEGELTVAMDITISEQLREEGIAREFVNRIQNLRKDSGLDVTDKIAVKIESRASIEQAIKNNLDYICAETLADSLELVSKVNGGNSLEVEVETGIETRIALEKI